MANLKVQADTLGYKAVVVDAPVLEGSEKQIAWAQDIISTTMTAWNQVADKYISEQQAKIEKASAKAESAPTELKREQRMKGVRREEQKLADMMDARETLESMDDAEHIIDNRDAITGVECALHPQAHVVFGLGSAISWAKNLKSIAAGDFV